MKKNNLSSQVRSTQVTAHPGLEQQLRRHLDSEWRQMPQQPTVDAFNALLQFESFSERKIVLDSGCGTGESTRLIAAHYPDCLVIGIDKSAVRLGRLNASSYPHREGNIIWLRAELAGFWALAIKAGWRLHRHFLLYPNPWPKPGQLKRRWHGHPVFPTLLKLGGRLEMRCNWDIYATEFAFAVEFATGLDVRLEQSTSSSITTPFERKYRNSGHQIFTVTTPELPGEPAIPQPPLPDA